MSHGRQYGGNLQNKPLHWVTNWIYNSPYLKKYALSISAIEVKAQPLTALFVHFQVYYSSFGLPNFEQSALLGLSGPLCLLSLVLLTILLFVFNFEILGLSDNPRRAFATTTIYSTEIVRSPVSVGLWAWLKVLIFKRLWYFILFSKYDKCFVILDRTSTTHQQGRPTLYLSPTC